jgi:hypothetical protein
MKTRLLERGSITRFDLAIRVNSRLHEQRTLKDAQHILRNVPAWSKNQKLSRNGLLGSARQNQQRQVILRLAGTRTEPEWARVHKAVMKL